MKTLDITGLTGEQIKDLVETHTGWRPTVLSPSETRSWSPSMSLTSGSIPVSALRKIINYDFADEGKLFSLAQGEGYTCESHGSGWPGDTGTTYVPEVRFVYEAT